MVVTKNQIRPRRKKFHFTNAELLVFDTTGFANLVPPAPAGQALAVDLIQVRANIAVIYGGIDAAAFFYFVDDFQFCTSVENDAGVSTTTFADLFGQTGINLTSFSAPQLIVDSAGFPVPAYTFSWNDYADLAANGGIALTWSNGGADFTGGDPANYLDVFVDYKIINLT